MTALRDIIAREIALTGPMRLDTYMALCLTHPEHGYYTSRDPLGALGDFTTAPEISQMFGELVGLWLADTWQGQGAPADFTLLELGPGRGPLMADALRATGSLPAFQSAALHLLETSPQLRALQAERLSSATPNWIEDLNALPPLPTYVIANEFFDALPIRQFKRTQAGWSECHVGLTGDALSFGWSSPAPVAALNHRMSDTRPDDIVEICPQATDILQTLAQHIERHGGALLLTDYGDWTSLGDTLQALSSHRPVDPLTAPGQADLTAHVDFAAIAAALAPLRHSRLTTQGVFLERLGITNRAQALAQNLSGDALNAHIVAHRRLTHPDEMGTLFKAMAAVATRAPLPAGFTE